MEVAVPVAAVVAGWPPVVVDWVLAAADLVNSGQESAVVVGQETVGLESDVVGLVIAGQAMVVPCVEQPVVEVSVHPSADSVQADNWCYKLADLTGVERFLVERDNL